MALLQLVREIGYCGGSLFLTFNDYYESMVDKCC